MTVESIEVISTLIMADVSDLSTTDYEDNGTDTTATIPSADSGFLSPIPRNDNDSKDESESLAQKESVSTKDSKPRHRRRKSGGRGSGRHKAKARTVSPSPGAGGMSMSGKKRDNVAMRRILDSAPRMIQVNDEEDGHWHQEAVSRVISEVYFDGNWNRGQYAVDNDNEEESKMEMEKEQTRSLGYQALRVFDDDEMFILCPSQRRGNRPDKGHFAPYQYRRSPFPLPSQRLKRILYPFKKYSDQAADFDAKLERLHKEEQDYYVQMRAKATKIKGLYQEVTALQMVGPEFGDIHGVKRKTWKQWEDGGNGQHSIGQIQESNIPEWINGKNGLFISYDGTLHGVP